MATLAGFPSGYFVGISLLLAMISQQIEATAYTSDSPAVFPVVKAANLSSFFPSPAAQIPLNSAVLPPVPEAFPPIIPSSGEFFGKSLADSRKLRHDVTIFGYLNQASIFDRSNEDEPRFYHLGSVLGLVGFIRP